MPTEPNATHKAIIGFQRGGHLPLELTDEHIAQLKEQLSGGGGWLDLPTVKGSALIDLSQVIYLKSDEDKASVGFGGFSTSS